MPSSFVIFTIFHGICQTEIWNPKKAASYALKICTTDNNGEDHAELMVTRFIGFVNGNHPGKDLLRLVLHDFTISGPQGSHQCLVVEPQGMTLTQYYIHLPEWSLDKTELQHTLPTLLFALGFLRLAGCCLYGFASLSFGHLSCAFH
jgi:hypothetical protein